MQIVSSGPAYRTGARPITALGRQLQVLVSRMEPADSKEDFARAELYGLLDRAKMPLGIPPGALSTLKHLIGYSRDSDWLAGRAPIVWPSNQTLADKDGISVGAIKARLRKLRSLGLILMKDSPNGHRHGHRDAQGRITAAYGIDLAPLRLRRDRLRELAEAWDSETRLFKDGRMAIGATRRVVQQALVQAAEAGLTGPHWVTLMDTIDAIADAARLARLSRDADAFSLAIGRLDTLETLVGETIDRHLFLSINDPKGLIESPHIQLQTNPNLDSVHAGRNRSSDLDPCLPSEPDFAPSPSGSRIRTTPDELAQMFPAAAGYIPPTRVAWSDIHAAAVRLRHDLGIRPGLWVEAGTLLDRDAASIAVLITCERAARHEIRTSPGAYFAGMMERAKRGELDLVKSLWGFRSGSRQ